MTADCLSQPLTDLAWVPLSSAQQRLWFFSRLESASSAYNLGGVLWLEGALDLAALRYGLDQLLARHAALRLVFAEQDGVARQAVLPVCPMPLERVDLVELAPALRTALDSNRLAIVDCPVDASENLRLTQRLGELVVPMAK